MKMRNKARIGLRSNLEGYLFISPWLLGFFALTGGPLLFSLYVSFTNYNITSRRDWIGLSNYSEMFFQDTLFWKSISNTLWYVAVGVPFSAIAAIAVSALLSQKVWGGGFFRMLFYLPTVLAGVAMYMLWMQMLGPQTGLINTVLRFFGIEGPSWLTDPAWTKPSLVLMRLWGIGTSMLLYLSAIHSVPKQLYEAAEIDGAGRIRRFFKITIPMITPIIFFDVVTTMIGAFQVFQEAYVMSENGAGGPASSLLFYNLHLFNEAFVDYRMGYASAMAWFLFVIVMIITVINMTASKYWVHYEGGDHR
ncbi:sugar ABC transporter permease [Paenibacillus lautus]|uniref:Sugar ABC transporter permease n=1 Tax=Paenibacillus lautus TaxID=1401 RepID=A0A385TR26_PAELA|nr:MULTISPECIES: sugar ABC transporter permease [Paenibacillus]AYB43565.1 sugar ABC transporter permease [Paenibacillus lautus]MBY0161113.1 sugar ABC transporter permease [Cytobacillus firmus]MCT1398705.1 sugar ABC transporter permease [Paenibacillus sp. p3-SID867]